MGNVRQYFDSDFKGFFWYEGPFELNINGVVPDPPVQYRILHHANSRASCVAFYVPPDLVNYDVCRVILTSKGWWMNIRDGVKIVDDTPGLAPLEISNTLFTGRVLIYLEGQLAHSAINQLQSDASDLDLDLVTRDAIYASQRDAIELPHAFISHDSRDKDSIARPLASTLSMNLCRVWYDEYSLRIGDSLRESIEDGLKKCKKCVLILTPNFLGNNRWTRKEYDAIFTREIIEEQRLILPIWAGVTREDVFQYSPILADRVAAIWGGDAEKLTRELLKVLL